MMATRNGGGGGGGGYQHSKQDLQDLRYMIEST